MRARFADGRFDVGERERDGVLRELGLLYVARRELDSFSREKSDHFGTRAVYRSARVGRSEPLVIAASLPNAGEIVLPWRWRRAETASGRG